VTDETFTEQYAEYAAGVRRRLDNPACLMCGDDSDKAMEWLDKYNSYVEGVLLCARCCGFAATAYVRAHGGAPPDAFEAYANPIYQKAKISRRLSKQVFERDAYRCVTCRSHIDLTCDHIIPESLGGPTNLENLQTMCRPCNSSKGARHP
jgi:5-methylcytosine-specific restriction endonuclease McrA